MRVLFILIVGLISVGFGQGTAFAKIQFEPCNSKLECAAQSVVSLLPNWPAGFSRNEEPEGSGIVLLDGKLIATADHVLGPAKSARIRTFNGEVLDAQIVMRDSHTDIAFLRVEKQLPAVKFSNQYSFGDVSCAIGNSFGLDLSLTCGVISAMNVSGVGFNRIEDFIQTDASVNPGMSGGALVDENGRLIGMLSAIFTRQSDANIGVNFAVSAELLRQVLDDFEDDGIVSHRRLGVVMRPNKPGEGGSAFVGLETVRVEPDSPEAQAGLKAGDVIIHANGRRIKRAGAYVAAVALLDTEQNLNLSILRDGEVVKIVVDYK